MVVFANSEIHYTYPVKLRTDFIIIVLIEVGILEMWLLATCMESVTMYQSSYIVVLC